MRPNSITLFFFDTSIFSQLVCNYCLDKGIHCRYCYGLSGEREGCSVLKRVSTVPRITTRVMYSQDTVNNAAGLRSALPCGCQYGHGKKSDRVK